MNIKKGAFTKKCGGEVTEECIEKKLKSPAPVIRKQAALARTFRNINNK